MIGLPSSLRRGADYLPAHGLQAAAPAAAAQRLEPRMARRDAARRAGLWPGVLLVLAFTMHPGAAIALSTDKDQPIEVEADSAELDDIKNVSVYRGNVIVDQGSIHMTGEIMTVYHTDEDELDHIILEGNPATYRQLPDDSQVHDEAEALRMEYHELKNLVILINKAVVTQDRLRFSGDRIEYDTELSQVRAWSTPGRSPAGSSEEKAAGERVKIIIKKKDKAEEPAGAAPK